MSLLNNSNKQKGKKANKNQKSNAQGSKFIPKGGKATGASQKLHRTGGTRGS